MLCLPWGEKTTRGAGSRPASISHAVFIPVVSSHLSSSHGNQGCPPRTRGCPSAGSFPLLRAGCGAPAPPRPRPAAPATKAMRLSLQKGFPQRAEVPRSAAGAARHRRDARRRGPQPPWPPQGPRTAQPLKRHRPLAAQPRGPPSSRANGSDGIGAPPRPQGQRELGGRRGIVVYRPRWGRR